LSFRPTIFDRDVATVNEAGFPQRLLECWETICEQCRRFGTEKLDHRHCRLLRLPRRDRKPAGVSDSNPRMSLELRSLLPYPNSCPGMSPHQQERDTKMAMLSFGGIDVSKNRLDGMVLPEEQCSSVPNDAAGWANLVEQLRGCSIAAIGIEASGGYERGVMRALLAAGIPARQVNPFKLRQFARASGVLAKNDPLPE
jgi:hypothetical protein